LSLERNGLPQQRSRPAWLKKYLGSFFKRRRFEPLVRVKRVCRRA
jgi:hypothetical protein